MSYYGAFKIKDTSKIRIPDFSNAFVSKPNSRLEYLQSLSEDVMTVKEFKELQEIDKSEKSVTINLLGKVKPLRLSR